MRTHILRLLLLLSVLCLLLSSCLQIPVGGPTPTQPATQGSVTAALPSEEATRPYWDPARPVWNDTQLTAAAQSILAAPSAGIVDVSNARYTYYAMQADLDALSKLYPALFSYRSIGKSVAGRDIYLAVLGNPNAPRRILVSAGIHGREYMTSQLTMKQLEFYLANYAVGTCQGIPYATLFEECCFYVLPMTNPDGVMISQDGVNSLPNEALRQQLLGFFERNTEYKNQELYFSHWKANANGVDLNRNYDAKWQSYAGATSPQAWQYKGPSPASEPETRAVVGLINSLPNLQAVLCIHSQGEVLYWNCGQPDPDRTLRLTEAISQLNGYEVIMKQSNDASLSDWCELEKSVPAVTVEIGKVSGNLLLPTEEFPKVWTANFNLLPYVAAYYRA